MAYIYCAEIFCDDCGEEICERLNAEGHAPPDPDDHYSFDSDEYPKQVDGTAEADSVQHCGGGDDCFNAIEFDDGWRIGVWLENTLTTDGEAYLIEAVRDGRETNNEVTALWEEWYDYLDFTIREVCEGCREDVDVDDLDEDNHCLDCREDTPNMDEI